MIYPNFNRNAIMLDSYNSLIILFILVWCVSVSEGQDMTFTKVQEKPMAASGCVGGSYSDMC